MLLEPTAQVMDLAVAIRCVERGVHAIPHPIRSSTSLAAALKARDLLLTRRYGFREVRATGYTTRSEVRRAWHLAGCPLGMGSERHPTALRWESDNPFSAEPAVSCKGAWVRECPRQRERFATSDSLS